MSIFLFEFKFMECSEHLAENWRPKSLSPVLISLWSTKIRALFLNFFVLEYRASEWQHPREWARCKNHEREIVKISIGLFCTYDFCICYTREDAVTHLPLILEFKLKKNHSYVCTLCYLIKIQIFNFLLHDARYVMLYKSRWCFAYLLSCIA